MPVAVEFGRVMTGRVPGWRAGAFTSTHCNEGRLIVALTLEPLQRLRRFQLREYGFLATHPLPYI
ncbi:hypothetical protein ABZ935_11985 [Streptomyces coeruleorubidus]|uniref:hypothetical protein n=1 Tax=Streptomyces coeruleorubidus TaxID=116188 RepID=UPI0033EF7AA7